MLRLLVFLPCRLRFSPCRCTASTYVSNRDFRLFPQFLPFSIQIRPGFLVRLQLAFEEDHRMPALDLLNSEIHKHVTLPPGRPTRPIVRHLVFGCKPRRHRDLQLKRPNCSPRPQEFGPNGE
jgi:hypothetical protein